MLPKEKRTSLKSENSAGNRGLHDGCNKDKRKKEKTEAEDKTEGAAVKVGSYELYRVLFYFLFIE